MTVNGRVHANGSIYTGTSASLTFNGTVTCTGTISSPAWNGQGPELVQHRHLQRKPAIPHQRANRFPVHRHHQRPCRIEMPAAGEGPTSTLGQSRYYNQAQTVLLVSNTTVKMIVQASLNYNEPGDDPSPLTITSTNTPSALSTNFPFLVTTNSFTDQRENKTVQTTQIDVGKYGKWLQTNSTVLTKFPAGSGTYPTILYVADNRTTTSSQIDGVRLTNGIALPPNGGLGWSVATPNPLYVLGNYNCTNSSYLASTNTTSSVPAAFMSDALTILSSNWKDSLSSSNYTSRTATDTTVDAAILTGIVPSTGSSSSQFSGGVHNLPRLLEDWNSPSTYNLWLNTAIMNLYNSQTATHMFVNPGTYYDPPTRHFSYDLNYRIPPSSRPASRARWSSSASTGPFPRPITSPTMLPRKMILSLRAGFLAGAMILAAGALAQTGNSLFPGTNPAPALTITAPAGGTVGHEQIIRALLESGTNQFLCSHTGWVANQDSGGGVIVMSSRDMKY